MIKILYVVSTLKRAGPVVQLYNIIKYLDREHFEPHLVTLSPEESSSMREDYERISVHVYSLENSRLKGLFYTKKMLKTLLAELQPDIIHTQGIRADLLSAGLNSSAVRFATQRNYPYHDYPQKFGILAGKLMATMHYRAFKKIPNLIACSKTIAGANLKHGLKTDYIQNGVDLELYNGSELIKQKNTIREKLGIAVGAVVFVSIGALIKRKNPEVIIKAFKKAERSGSDSLIFVGDGQLKAKCEELASHSNNIKFVGNREDVRHYLAAADCFISASQSEGLPNAVIEALAMRIPVFLSDIPAHKEVLEIEPSAGILFEEGNLKQLSELIKAYAYDGGASLAAEKIVQTRLNARMMSGKYQEKYLQVTGYQDAY